MAGPPNGESALATCTAIEVEIRAAVAVAAPAVTWVLDDPPSQSGCNTPLDNCGGRTVTLSSYGSRTPVPDDAAST